MSLTAESAPEASASVERRRAWLRALLLFALTTVLLFVLRYETLYVMVRVWLTSDTFGYGVLILPIVAFLTYQRREQLALLVPRPCYWAVAWIAVALLLQLIGSIGNLMLFEQLAFIGLWQGLFALFMGATVVRHMAFPLFFLVFAVPMGAEVVPLLQRFTAEICVFLLRASGMPTFLSGIFIEIPSGAFVVAEVCSGARFLITALVLGTLAAHLFFRSWRRRIAFMLLCLVVPILANGLRAYGIIMLAHLSDYELAVSVDHIIYGLIFLSFVLLILTGLGALFRDRWPENMAPQMVDNGPAPQLSSGLIALCLSVFILGGGEIWARQVTAIPETVGPVELAPLQPADGWRLAEQALDGWEPAFPGADSQLLLGYQANEGEVALFVAHYLYQRQGHEVINVGNTIVGSGMERKVTRFERIEVDVAGRSQALQETMVRAPGGARLIWSWYEVGGTATTSPVAGKLLEIWHTLNGGSRAATAFALATNADDGLEPTRERLGAFLNALNANQSLAVSLLRTEGSGAPGGSVR